MGLFDKIKALVSGTQSKLPEDINSVGEIRDKAQSFAAQHAGQINSAADSVQQKIPGQTDDKLIDAAQAQLNTLAKKDQAQR